MNKTVISLSLFNPHRHPITEVTTDVFKNAKVVLFCIDKEYADNKSVFDNLPCEYYRSTIEDIDWTETKSQHDELVRHLGEYQIPNKAELLKIKNFIGDAERVIIACSAGMARSGATTLWLIDNGYTLHPDYNTKFYPNQMMQKLYRDL